MRALSWLLAALLLGSSAAYAVNWLELDGGSAAGGLGLDVDTDSLRPAGAPRAVTVRVSYPEPRIHRSGARYRSAVVTVEFGCDVGLTGFRDAIFHSEPEGQGAVTAREDGRLGPVPEGSRNLLPARSVELLIRAACAHPATAEKG
jgi:hypothetical protein